MNFFDHLRSWFIKAANVFLNLALDAYSWPIVGGWLGDGFAALVDFASECAYALWNASNWYEDTVDQLRDIMSWSAIRNLIRGYWPGIDDAISWFSNAFSNVLSIIDTWWATVLDDIQEMIDAATQGIDDLLTAWDNFWNVTWPELVGELQQLKSVWDNFWSVTFPSLVSFDALTTWWTSTIGEVQEFIDDAFRLRENLWSGWQEIRDQVFEFFGDPWAWLEQRFADWFFGGE